MSECFGFLGECNPRCDDSCEYDRVPKSELTALRAVLLGLTRDLEAVTKNLTACQELNTKQVMEIRSLRAELDQAKLPPVEGTIFEDRDRWMQRAIDAEAKVGRLTKRLVPEFEWKSIRGCKGVEIHYADLRGYHAEIRRLDGGFELGVWVFDGEGLSQIIAGHGYDLDDLKKGARDVIVNSVIGEGDNAVQRDLSG